jgi:serine protease Do
MTLKKMLDMLDRLGVMPMFGSRIFTFTTLLSIALLVMAAGALQVNAQVTPQSLSASFADVAKIVEPAVVNIEAKGKVSDISAKGAATPADPDDIMDFFRRQLPRRPQYAVGSGFIVDKSGYILTNAHVIENAARITVKLDSGEEFIAKVVGSDEQTDLALLKVEAGKDLPFVKLGNSDDAQVGDWVLAIGSPFGLARTVTAGIVSQTKRATPQSTPFQRFIQTDAAINKGNSGGPLVNLKGEVIGVNSQIATSTGDSNGIGFALPSNDASSVYSQLLKDGKVHRGFLGVALESVKPEYAKVYGLSDASGAIVTEVKPVPGPAAEAGIKVGDVIVEVNGQKVANAEDLIAKVANIVPQKDVTISYLREEGAKVDRKTVSVRLIERPLQRIEDSQRKLPVDGSPTDQRPFGLTLVDVTPTLAETYKVEGQKGVIVKEINPASYIADVKMSNGSDAFDEGDLIQRINRQPVVDLKSFNTLVSKLKPGDAVVMEVLAYNRLSRSTQMKVVQFTVQ